MQLFGSLIGVGYPASYVFNAVLAKRQDKNPVLWFFLSFPLGPLVTIYLYRSANRKNEELAAAHVRREIIRNKELEQQEEAKRRQLEQQEESRRWQEAIRAKELEQKNESAREWEAMKAKIAEQHEEDRLKRAESQRVEAFNADYMNSRFKRFPKNLDEWVETSQDYSLLTRLLSCVSEGRGDSLEAPNFPTKVKEVVFLQMHCYLTDNLGTRAAVYGDVYVTNKRVVFHGRERIIEWNFSKMISYEPFDSKKAAVFNCTDRRVVKGVCLGNQDWFKFRFFLQVAFESAKGSVAELVTAIAAKSQEYDQQKPSS